MVCFAVILMILGIALIIFSVWAEKKSLEYSEKLQSFISAAKEYSAAVLDITNENGKKAAIIQIRIEEQKRTLVHRCTEPFRGDYKRGDRISVYFIEGMPADRSVIKGDNTYERFIAAEKKYRLAERLCGGTAAVIGIILLIIR